MRYTERDQPESTAQPESGPRIGETVEERLLRENQELRRQLRNLNAAHGSPTAAPHGAVWRPSRLTIVAIVLGSAAVLGLAFVAGYIPLQQRKNQIEAEAAEQERTLPRVEVLEVGRAARKGELELPGSIQAITEAPILARADGYVLRRLVDLGDKVLAGQPMAEIDAPELDAQVRRGKASVEQAQAALAESVANLEQGKSEMELARVNAERWNALVGQGVVSKQQNDQYQSQYQAKLAGVKSLEKTIMVRRSAIAAAEADVARFERMQSYRVVRAPFDGIVTLRNVDTGALVNTGNTLLFRIAQIDTLRTYVNVPQTHANSVRPGQPAVLTVANLPGREFTGRVARTASALDASSRTLLVEVHVPNTGGALLPGMYAQVDLSSARSEPPLLISSDALIVHANGAQVAVVGPNHTVHLQKIDIGRDYGDKLEVISGLRQGDMVITNPGDAAREGLQVDPVPVAQQAEKHAGGTAK